METNRRVRDNYHHQHKGKSSVRYPVASFTKRTVAYNIYTLWLFTVSDLQTIVVQKSAFGIFTILSGRLLTSNARPQPKEILYSIPFTAIWIWLNLLPLNMNNQSDMDSILEDRVNKPWRPIPSGRLAAKEARQLTNLAYMVAILASTFFGGLLECLLLIIEGWLYNRLGGANQSWPARNLLNSAGYMTFACGAARIACASSGAQLNEAALTWFVLLGLVVFTTIQLQDLYDQEGDAQRQRRTIPLVFGDASARLSIAIPVGLWSCFCPFFWGLQLHGYILPIALGTAVSSRIYRYRSVSEDRKSFLLWNIWIMSLYLLPLGKTFM